MATSEFQLLPIFLLPFMAAIEADNKKTDADFTLPALFKKVCSAKKTPSSCSSKVVIIISSQRFMNNMSLLPQHSARRSPLPQELVDQHAGKNADEDSNDRKTK